MKVKRDWFDWWVWGGFAFCVLLLVGASLLVNACVAAAGGNPTIDNNASTQPVNQVGAGNSACGLLSINSAGGVGLGAVAVLAVWGLIKAAGKATCKYKPRC